MTAPRRPRLVRRRPLSLVTIALMGAVVVILLAVWLAVYRPAAVALGLATFVVILTWGLDRRDRLARARRVAAARPVGPPVPPGPPGPPDRSAPP